MRVTQRVMVNNFLYNTSKNYKAMGKIQQQLATGHKVSKPSDNPFVVTRTMELKASIAANERYKQNIDEAIGWTDTQEMALGQMNDVLQKIRQLTVQGASSGSNSETDKLAIATQLEQLKEELVEIANTSYDGRYVLSGQSTTQKPFELDSNGNAVYKGAHDGLSKELARGVSLDIGIDGSDFFREEYNSTTKDPTSEGIFNTINKIIDSLQPSPTGTESTSSLIGTLDKNMENISTIRSECGARQNRLEDMKNKNETETFNMTTLLSKTYDIDVAETYTEALVLEAVYQSSLNVGARIIQPSILDFLK